MSAGTQRDEESRAYYYAQTIREYWVSRGWEIPTVSVSMEHRFGLPISIIRSDMRNGRPARKLRNHDEPVAKILRWKKRS